MSKPTSEQKYMQIKPTSVKRKRRSIKGSEFFFLGRKKILEKVTKTINDLPPNCSTTQIVQPLHSKSERETESPFKYVNSPN